MLTPSSKFDSLHIEPCDGDLFLLTQICQYSLLIKHSTRLPHILRKQTYWLGFQGRIRAAEQVQTFGPLAGDESPPDVHSQLFVGVCWALAVWGYINDLAWGRSSLYVPVFRCAPQCVRTRTNVQSYTCFCALLASQRRDRKPLQTHERGL